MVDPWLEMYLDIVDHLLQAQQAVMLALADVVFFAADMIAWILPRPVDENFVAWVEQRVDRACRRLDGDGR